MDKFKLGKKWFWIGIIISFLNGIAGLIYGIALMTELEHKKEGGIIIVWAIFSIILAVFITSYLQSLGYLPQSALK